MLKTTIWLNKLNIDFHEKSLINGKKKGIIKTHKDIDEKTLMDQIIKESKINKIFENKKINKIFFVKNRLINILLG